MSLVASDSPLRSLPANLNPHQAMYFDGIRYSLDMAGIAYVRLRQGLFDIDAFIPERKSDIYPMLFLDAWSMVDSLNRLRVLLGNFRGMKNTPEKRVFLDGLTPFLALRNNIQHLDGTIKEVKAGEPAWGHLSWFHVDALSAEGGIVKGRSRLLVSGQLKDFSHNLVNPLGKPIETGVDLVTLTAFGDAVSLSRAFYQIRDFAKIFDKTVKTGFEDSDQLSGATGSDLFITAEMAFGPATTQDEPFQEKSDTGEPDGVEPATGYEPAQAPRHDDI